MQDPKIMALLQNNPQAPQLQAIMMAHINEHAGFLYRQEIEKQMGMALPPQSMNDMNEEEVNMSPEVEYALSQKMAQAANQLLQQNKAQAQQQQAQQQAQDPIIQMQQQELQIKAQDQQRKVQKDLTDAQLKMKQLEIESQRIQSQQRIAAGQMLAKGTIDQKKLKSQQVQSAGKIMSDIVSSEQKNTHNMASKALDHMSKRELTAQQAEHQLEIQKKQAKESE
jgi:hypothetical protein